MLICLVFCCTDCYHEAVSGTDPSSDAEVRLRTKYNSALLRSRRLQKQINELSLSSLPAETLVPRRGHPQMNVSIAHRSQPDNSRHGPEAAAELQPLGAKSYSRFVSHSIEFIHGATDPTDSRHRHSKPVTNQNRSNTLAVASRIHVHTGDRSQCYDTHCMNKTDKAEFCTTVDKRNTNIGGAVRSAGGNLSSPEIPKMLPAYGNTKAVEMCATLPRKSRQRKTTQQHWPEVGNVPQQTFNSGISHMCWTSHASGHVSSTTDGQLYPEMSKLTRRQDKPSMPGHSSLPRLKISWFVTNDV